MIVAISGKSGCGNTTVSKLLAERLGWRFLNYTFRTMAEEMGIPFERLLALAKEDPAYDRKLDARQIELAREGDTVVGSRLAVWLFRDEAFTVWLDAGFETRVGRIVKREGGDFAEAAAFHSKRDADDHARYLALYGIDNDDVSHVSLVIDVDNLSPAEIVDRIVEGMGKAPERKGK